MNFTFQRYGFLYKPYTAEAAYWEVVILVRKALLQLVARFTTTRPYVQGCLSLSVYFPILIIQARVSPYRQMRHTNMANYLLAVNMLATFSTLVFSGDVLSERAKAVLLVLNLLTMFAGWGVSLYGGALDVYLFLLRQVYVGYCEQHDGADPQVDSYYLSVDRPGLLNIAWCG